MREDTAASPSRSLVSAGVATGLLLLAALAVALLVPQVSDRVDHAHHVAQVLAVLLITISRWDRIQRLMGCGHIEGRPLLRTLVGSSMFAVGLVSFGMPFLLPVGVAVVVTVHVQWSGPRLWLVGVVIAVVGSVAAQAAGHAGWLPTSLAPSASDRIAVMALLLAVAVMGNAGVIARQRERETAAADVDRQLRQDELLHAAAHDALTGLLGRAGITDHLREAAAAAAPGAGTAVLFLDLDSFKAINDTHGHETGDRVLVAAAGRFRHALREQDDLARTGGDEFVALMTAVPERETASRAADRLTQALVEPIDVDGLLLTVGVSVGWVYADAPGSVEDLLRAADAAMYAVKRSHYEQQNHALSSTSPRRGSTTTTTELPG